MAATAKGRTLEELLAEARARIDRLEPGEALAATESGALLIDIRSDVDRERDGVVPGSLHVPRSVLEWRLAPDSDSRSPYLGEADRPIVLLCDHGCSSVLAAATLVDLGFVRVGDVVGGFAGWRAAGLPTMSVPERRRGSGEPAGMRPPD